MIAQPAKAQQRRTAPVVDDQSPRIASDLARCCDTCRELAGQLTQYESADELFGALVNSGELVPAIRLAGHWLPKRKSVWWACTTVWWKLREAGIPQEQVLIDTVVQWVLAPDDELRRAVGQQADQLPKTSAAALLGQSVFWSEGSVAPPHCPPVEPPSQLAGHYATSAVIRIVGTDAAAQRQALRLAAETRYGAGPWITQQAEENH